MKKVIGGKIYDTETAEIVGTDGNSLRNFYSTRETLYRTKKGQYFMHGESSAGGVYGRQDDSTWYGGEEIILLSPQEAQKWAEENLQADKVAEFFSVVEG